MTERKGRPVIVYGLDPDRSPVLARAFQLAVENPLIGDPEVARRMTGQGLRTKAGKRGTRRRVQDVLRAGWSANVAPTIPRRRPALSPYASTSAENPHWKLVAGVALQVEGCWRADVATTIPVVTCRGLGGHRGTGLDNAGRGAHKQP